MMMSKLRTPEGLFVLLAVCGLIFFIAAWLTGEFDSLMEGIGVEIIGALITAGGVIGLERILSTPDPDTLALREEIQSLKAELQALRGQSNSDGPHTTI